MIPYPHIFMHDSSSPTAQDQEKMQNEPEVNVTVADVHDEGPDHFLRGQVANSVRKLVESDPDI
jgi:hypothetical protein